MGDIDLDRIIADLQEKRARLARMIEERTSTEEQREKLIEAVDRLKARLGIGEKKEE